MNIDKKGTRNVVKSGMSKVHLGNRSVNEILSFINSGTKKQNIFERNQEALNGVHANGQSSLQTKPNGIHRANGDTNTPLEKNKNKKKSNGKK